MKWIKVTDKLPESDKQIIFTDMDEICQGYYYDGIFSAMLWECRNDCGWIFDSCDCGYRLVATHWMPLPDKPTE